MERQKEIIGENIRKVKERIASAATKSGRKPEEIKLIVVTKGRSIEQIEAAIKQGCTELGENRIDELAEKAEKLKGRKIVWHFIGHLQGNKAKKAVELSDCIHSVDSLKLLGKIENAAKEFGKRQKIFIEVNISGEGSKFGIKPGELENFLREAKKFQSVEILGLMTMAPLAEAEKARPVFRKLKELAGKFGLRELSMGMTNDFEVAVEEGATFVRVGSAVFENK